MAPMADETTITPAPIVRRTKRGRSLLGNLNGTRRPWAVFWKRRALRPEDRWVLPLLERYTAGLVDDKGGPDNMSAAELRMVELAQLARACSLLVLSTAANEGGLAAPRKGPDLPSTLARFLNVERQTLVALGLERRARPVPSLRELIAARTEPDPPTA
jgi:hypothetical protein